MVAERFPDGQEEVLPEWLQSQPPVVPGAVRQELIRTHLAAQLERKITNEYRSMSAFQLKDEQEYWGWMVIEYLLRQQSNPEADFTYSMYVATANLELVERAMARLKALREDSGAKPPLGNTNRRAIDFSRVKEMISIDRFVSQIAYEQPVMRTANRYKVQCMLPGHTDEHSPSFTVYLDQESCWCYGCQRGGDVVELARHWFDQPNGAIAVEHLCGLMGVPVPRTKDHRPAPQEATGSGPAMAGPDGKVVSFDAALMARRGRRGR